MRKIIIGLSILFIIGCSSTSYDDGTTKHQAVTKINTFDDGTNKYQKKNVNFITKMENNNTKSNNFSNNSTSFITRQESSAIANHNIKRPETLQTKSNEKSISIKNTESKVEVPKSDAVKIPIKTVSPPVELKKNNPVITSKYDIFYPTDEIVILKDYSEKVDNRNSGIDFRVGSLTPVKATAPGMVIFSGNKPSLGNSVFLFHNDGFISIYYNLDMLKVNKGDYIKNYDTEIGTAKDSFHFELRKQTSNGLITIDPKIILKKRRN